MGHELKYAPPHPRKGGSFWVKIIKLYKGVLIVGFQKNCRMHLWVPPIATRKKCGPQVAQNLSRPHYRLNGNKIIRGGRYWNSSTIFGRIHLWVPPIASRKNCVPQAAQKLSRPHYRLNEIKIIRGGRYWNSSTIFWQDASLGTSDSL